jgi:hypothetical protein
LRAQLEALQQGRKPVSHETIRWIIETKCSRSSHLFR